MCLVASLIKREARIDPPRREGARHPVVAIRFGGRVSDWQGSNFHALARLEGLEDATRRARAGGWETYSVGPQQPMVRFGEVARRRSGDLSRSGDPELEDGSFLGNKLTKLTNRK
jgi:hypothetical protein